MPRKVRELETDLARAGYRKRAGKGSHRVWEHSLVPESVTMSGKSGDDADRYQEKQVRDAIRRVRDAQWRRQP